MLCLRNLEFPRKQVVLVYTSGIRALHCQ